MDRFARMKDVLIRAQDLPESARIAYLDNACKDDPELRREVESMLAHGENPATILEPGAAAPHLSLWTTLLRHALHSERGRHTPRPSGAASVAPGDVLAHRYRVESHLTSGGMGQVYRVQDLELDVPLALRTFPPRLASDPTALRRLEQAVSLAHSFSHPNVCRIFELGHDDRTDITFLTMELLDGETLASRIRTAGALEPDQALPVVRQLASALDAAHRAGIVHRDFKSSNVMLVPTPDGHRAVVTDLGLAEMVDEAEADASDPHAGTAPSSLLGTRGIAGTAAYMAPEQMTGAPLGPHTDLYALGVVLFEMCTGQLPFRGATSIDTAHAHVASPPPPPSTLSTVDQRWEQTILHLLAKDPADRYPTAHDAVLALEGKPGASSATRRAIKRHR